MIEKQIFYGVSCDRCKVQYEGSDNAYWSDEDTAIENAIDSDWIEIDDKHYCSDCMVYDDELDENVPLPDFPDCIDILKEYIRNDLKTYYFNFSNQGGLTIMSFDIRKPLVPDHKIGEILGDLFDSVEVIQKHTYTFIVKIYIKI